MEDDLHIFSSHKHKQVGYKATFMSEVKRQATSQSCKTDFLTYTSYPSVMTSSRIKRRSVHRGQWEVKGTAGESEFHNIHIQNI